VSASRELWLDDPLGFLIGPERVADFLARIYEREALVVPNTDRARFTGLISIDDIDRRVTGTDLREGDLSLADASRNLKPADYVDAAGFVDRGSVARLHREGATIIMQQAHQAEPSLGRFCRALEHVFSSHVQTNLYLTPPNAQGFRTHYDNHCVLVLQIAGEKLWRLYDMPIDTPYRGEGFQSGEHPVGELKQEFLLKAGDCAYVPRGLMHDARTSGDEPSLHITVGFITRTWADLMLEAVSEVALRSPELRRSLPAGFAQQGFDRVEARARLKRLAEHVAAEIALDPALDLLADTFIRSRAADNRGAIATAAQAIAPTDRFRAQKRIPHRIADDDPVIILIAPGGELKFAAADKSALERALSGEPFAVADLPSEASARIAAELLAYGLIARA